MKNEYFGYTINGEHTFDDNLFDNFGINIVNYLKQDNEVYEYINGDNYDHMIIREKFKLPIISYKLLKNK